MTCRADDRWTHQGRTCIRLENRWLAVDIFPELGGKIHRLVDKRYDRDVLWHSRTPPRSAGIHSNFDDNWSGGWDEIFPTALVCENEDGELLPHMGELWTQAGSYEFVERSGQRIELALRINTPITPAQWERRLILDAESPRLILRYAVRNVAQRSFSFEWGLHPALAITESFRLEAPATVGEVAAGNIPVSASPGTTYAWPHLGGVDLRNALPMEANAYALHYLSGLSAGWVAATDTSLKTGFGLVFDPEIFSCVWLWLVYGGWRGHYHAILEPWTSYPATLTEAIAAGRARSLPAGAELQTEVTAVLYHGLQSVSSLKADASASG